MESKIVYRFDLEQNITSEEVAMDYVLQDRESFSLHGFIVPIWNNGVVEGATPEQIENANIIIDNGLGYQLANEHENRIISTGSQGVLGCSVQLIGNQVIVNKHLGSNDWHELTLDNVGVVEGGTELTPHKLNRQRVYKLNGYLTLNDADSISSEWATGSYRDSNDPTNYIGHRSASATIQDETITFTAKFKGDLYLYYIGRNAGGILSVTVNNEAPVLVDTYNSVNNSYKQKAFITSIKNDVIHTITIRNTGTTNNTGTQTWFNALEIVSDNFKPADVLVKPANFLEGLAVKQYDEIIGANGLIYVAKNTGTTGATIPSHTGGTVSDGSIDWLRIANTSFSVSDFLIQSAGSELEYAYKAGMGDGVLEDVGGNLHKNEFISQPMKVFVDGNLTDISDGVIKYGNQVTIQQNITGFYGDYSTKTDIANVIQFHDFNNTLFNVRYEMEFLVETKIGWFYTAMFPFLTYASYGFRKQFMKLYTPQFEANLEDYEGVTGAPIIGNKKDFIMIAEGRAYAPKGTSTAPSTEPAKTGITIALKCDSYGVNDFKDSNEINAGVAVNTNAGTAVGNSSWASKMYFQRISTAQNYVAQAGEVIKANNRYYVKLQPNKYI